ncbi:UDP-N-acetylglucosamine 2-epimerase [Tropicibacter sp. Alg240-R139]|uniref:UDP-N-acetylglucosamine 2-epimerase n=1 Tax=Tropicibacter sp. Alg240-R139 TaxID=2305991 RepID=UPI0013DFA7E6|nr:UDP-N-acetylglucosamine 2-epimerase [Tropicibacter sp. Alg240-R139]
MKIHYVTGSRADFGLMRLVLQHLNAQAGLDVACVVTGQNLLEKYGNSRADIVQSGLRIARDIPVELSGRDGAEMGQALAHELLGFLDCWQDDRPDLVLVLGDRGEMLAAALAAVHLGIHVAHIHGGEVSGTLDESFRHAISKLAHFHFPANGDAADRLRRMGEQADHIWTTGAPGLVGVREGTARDPNWLRQRFDLKVTGAPVLVVFHPVVQQAAQAAEQTAQILQLLLEQDCHGLIMRPNSDAGAELIDQELDRFAASPEHGGRFRILAHLERSEYLNCLANCDLMIGNSSSGIIESASFDLACLNLGDRQNGRLRNANVVDCPDIDLKQMRAAFQTALTLQPPFENAYGDGKTAERMAKILPDLPLTQETLSKINAY